MELVFELGVGFSPEGLEVFCHLHRAVARGEDMERKGMATKGDLEFALDSVEILDARGEDGVGGVGIGDLRAAAGGEFEALRGLFFHELLLGVREEGFRVGQDGAVLDVAVTGGAVADQENDVVALVLSHLGQSLLGAKSGEKIDTVDPLLDSVVPAIEPKVSSKNFGS